MKGFAWRQLRDPEQERGNHRRHRAELTAMVLDNSELRDDGRRVCENNLLALCYVLGYCLIDEHVHHEALHFFPEKDSLNQTSEEMSIGIKRRRTLMYPRNTYKSTLDIANCVQIILHYYMTIAILILSGNKDLAYAFVNEVASHFVKPYNRAPSLFQALYPELCISKQPESGESHRRDPAAPTGDQRAADMGKLSRIVDYRMAPRHPHTRRRAYQSEFAQL